MRSVIFLILFVIGGSLTGSAQSQKPSEDDVIRVDTQLVVLPVRVAERGKAVFGLTREQFRVFEDGVEQEISYFARDAVSAPAGRQDRRQISIRGENKRSGASV